MRRLGRKGSSRFFLEQRGISLIEILIALGILGFIGLGFLSALWTTSNNTDVYAERVTAANLAQSQMEEIKAMSYDPTAPTNPAVYPVVVTPLPGYTISISEVEVLTGKQEVTVTVSRDGRGLLFKLTTTKSDW